MATIRMQRLEGLMAEDGVRGGRGSLRKYVGVRCYSSESVMPSEGPVFESRRVVIGEDDSSGRKGTIDRQQGDGDTTMLTNTCGRSLLQRVPVAHCCWSDE